MAGCLLFQMGFYCLDFVFYRPILAFSSVILGVRVTKSNGSVAALSLCRSGVFACLFQPLYLFGSLFVCFSLLYFRCFRIFLLFLALCDLCACARLADWQRGISSDGRLTTADCWLPTGDWAHIVIISKQKAVTVTVEWCHRILAQKIFAHFTH